MRGIAYVGAAYLKRGDSSKGMSGTGASHASVEPASDPRYELNMVTLYFQDGRTELAYARDNMTRALPLVRISLFFACLLYAAFGILDYRVLPHSYTEIWLIRFGIVCPIIFLVIGSTFLSRFFHRFSQALLSACMMATGFGVVAMTWVSPPPVNAMYYAGLIMVVIYGSTLVRLKFAWATIISIALFGAYQTVAVELNPIPPTTLVANNFFLVMATMVGIFASYIQELYIRRNWIGTQLLLREKDRSETLLAESQAANHAKSEFLAIVSHELRTPLNAIIGFSEFLKLEMFGPLGSGRYRSYAEDIYTSGQHLLQIINDILDLSRAEANKLELSEDEFELEAVIDTCMRMFRNKASEDGVRLVWESDVGVTLKADQRLTTQALINLLSNAIKFTGKGGQVLVSVCEDENGSCCLAVSDTGIGIAEADIPRIMEPFVQVESSISRQHEGLGLGLPLVKRIAELHGGRVDVESTVGKGTRVEIILTAERVLTWRSPLRAIAATGTNA